MKVIDSPTAVSTFQTSEPQKFQKSDARARAIQMLTSQAAPQETTPSAVQSAKEELIAAQNNSTVETVSEQSLATEPASEAIETVADSEVEVAPTLEDTVVSERFAKLAKQEQALRAQKLRQEAELKAREDALIAREAAATGQKPTQPSQDMSQYVSKDQIKRNPLQFLQEAGVSYEDITNQYLNQEAINPHMQQMFSGLQEQVAELQKQLAEAKDQQKTAQDDNYKAAVKQIESDVKKLAYTNPDFEMVKVTGSYKDAVELIEATWKEKGVLLTNEEALQQVEDYLVSEAEKLAKTDKIKKRLTPAASTQVEGTTAKPQAAQPKQQPQQMKTLTNANSVPRQMSAKERAIAAFKGQL